AKNFDRERGAHRSRADDWSSRLGRAEPTTSEMEREARSCPGSPHIVHRGVRVVAVDTPSVESPTPSFPEILTTALAAEMLHVHVEYRRRMVREERIPAHRFPGGREIRFLRDELIEWVREQPGSDQSPSAAAKSSP